MPFASQEARRAYARTYYDRNRQKYIDGSKRRQDVKRWRAKRKAIGLKASGNWAERWHEYVDVAAKRGREYWPRGCRVSIKQSRTGRAKQPWHGLGDTDAYRIRYAMDHEFAQRERERMSARRFLQPEYGAQWERNGNRWIRAAQSADGSVTREFLRLIRREMHCAYCGEHTKAKDRHLDHVWPLARGGTHSADNLVMACAECNRSKRDTMPLQYMLQCRGSL